MIRQTHLVASRLASRRGLSHWALSALLLAVSGCSVECHSSTSHSTSSSSGNERTVVHEHENEGNEPARAQSGRGDVVRVVSTEKPDSSNPPADANGHEHGHGRGHGNRQVVHPSGSTPSNHTEAEGGGSAGASGADSAAAGAASGGADSSSGAASSSGETPADSGASAGAASEQPEAGKKPRTPSNKRENEPHVARPVKKRPVAKGENREADEGSSVNKTGSRE